MRTNYGLLALSHRVMHQGVANQALYSAVLSAFVVGGWGSFCSLGADCCCLSGLMALNNGDPPGRVRVRIADSESTRLPGDASWRALCADVGSILFGPGLDSRFLRPLADDRCERPIAFWTPCVPATRPTGFLAFYSTQYSRQGNA